MAALVALIAVVLFACAFSWRARIYRRWCGLEAARDDEMRFLDPAQQYTLCETGGFDAPAIGECTALLRVQVRPTLLGRLANPWLEFSRGTQRWRQYLERAASGARCIDVTPALRSFGAGRVTISSRGLRTRAVELTTFEAPACVAPLLVLAPHPDDAEIAAFGLYSSHSAWVATVTAGDAGGCAPSLVERRVMDSLSAPARAGVPRERCINLAFPDGALSSMARAPAAPHSLNCESSVSRTRLRALNAHEAFRAATRECTWIELVDTLGELLELSRPKVVVTPHPRLDAHPDHVATTRALAQALSKWRLQPDILFYVVHARDCAAYPLGPAGSLAALPPVSAIQPIADGVYSYALNEQSQRTKREALNGITMLRDASTPPFARVAARLAGIARPASFLRRAVRPQEIFYRARAAHLPAMLAAVDSGEPL
jgi:LmbE family N-acetylglucosaminyl deacetylase